MSIIDKAPEPHMSGRSNDLTTTDLGTCGEALECPLKKYTLFGVRKATDPGVCKPVGTRGLGTLGFHGSSCWIDQENGLEPVGCRMMRGWSSRYLTLSHSASDIGA
jgi:hypothetical protein